jgi:hypothetical protein
MAPEKVSEKTKDGNEATFAHCADHQGENTLHLASRCRIPVMFCPTPEAICMVANVTWAVLMSAGTNPSGFL